MSCSHCDSPVLARDACQTYGGTLVTTLVKTAYEVVLVDPEVLP